VGRETILLVEDELAVRRLLRETLEEYGYRVIEAGNGAAALEIAKVSDEPIDLLITDVVMPEMSGPALAESLSRERPGMRVVYMSGYAENAIVKGGVVEPGIVFIQKPCAMEIFLQKVREVLDVGRKRILVVEDSQTTRTLEEVILKHAGYEVLVAADSRTACEQLQKEQFELVITDVALPGIDGFALTQAIRNEQLLRNVRVMILSGSCSDEGQQRSQAAGADVYLEKSTLDEKRLLDAVHRLLRKPKSAR